MPKISTKWQSHTALIVATDTGGDDYDDVDIEDKPEMCPLRFLTGYKVHVNENQSLHDYIYLRSVIAGYFLLQIQLFLYYTTLNSFIKLRKLWTTKQVTQVAAGF